MKLRHGVKSFVVAMVIALGTMTVITEVPDSEFTPPDNLAEGWYARIETTMGRIIARLLPDQAPQSVAHFTALAEGRLEWFDRISGELKKGHYYDGIEVHRAVAGQRFEAGDQTGSGRGQPDIFVPREGAGPIDFNGPGRLGMTRDGGAISGVQFFATASAQPWLSGNHPCFGVVVEGRGVIANISQVKTYENGRPMDPPVIERIRIFSVGSPGPLPSPEPFEPQRMKLDRSMLKKKP